MKRKMLTLTGNNLPEGVRKIKNPPKQLFCRGIPLAELLKRPRVAIVGSRGPSTYGQQVTVQLARQLAEQGIVIVSGLALGIDALAHQTALESGGLCIAVLPGPVGKIYPTTNRRLAEQILDQGGALVSEYDGNQPTYRWNFIARNRLVAALAQAVLISEAGTESGSLHTARFGHKQGKKVLAVPGPITSKLSAGTNDLLKKYALPATNYQDVLRALKLRPHKTPARQLRGQSANEQKLLDLLLTGLTDSDELLERSNLATSEFNQTLTMLEISGQIRPLDANHWALR